MNDLPPPSMLLWAAEVPRGAWAVAQLALRGAIGKGPRGDGRPVLILPGLFNTDRSNVILRRHLHALGYDARGWGLGRNLGQRTIGTEGEQLLELVESIHAETGLQVTLIGVSLGGIMARFAAVRKPQHVREVITIASPFAGSARSTNVWRAFEWITGESIDNEEVKALLAEAAGPLSVPATALWSRTDGLVNGTICHDDHCQGIEIQSSHVGVQLHPEVLRIVAETLAER